MCCLVRIAMVLERSQIEEMPMTAQPQLGSHRFKAVRTGSVGPMQAALDKIGYVLGTPARGVSTVLVEGEAGSGVTTVLAEATRLGAAAHRRILRGAATGTTRLALLLDVFGGTELAGALRAALDVPPDPCGRARLVRHMVNWIG